MEKRKFRIVLGMCGPTPLQTNIIKANDKRDAVIQYLNSDGQEVTEENINKYIDHTYESLPKPKREKGESIVDAFGKPITTGNTIVFIRNERHAAPVAMIGTVFKISNSSICVRTDENDEYRLLCAKESSRVERAVVMKERGPRSGEKCDATGYPIRISDEVAFMENTVVGASRSFIKGVVKDLKNTKAAVEYTRGETPAQMLKSYSKIIVL